MSYKILTPVYGVGIPCQHELVGDCLPIFVKENTRMLFGDPKATVQQLAGEFKES